MPTSRRHDVRRVWTPGLVALPRWAGVTCERCLLLGANTPKRVRLNLGFGTRAARRAMKSRGVPNDVGGAVPVRCLECIAHMALTRQGRAFGRYRRAGDISAQTLQLSSLVRLCCDTGME